MISKCTNHLSNARRPFQMLRLVCYLSKCSNHHQNVRNPHRKSKQCSKHTTGSRNAQIVFKNVRNPHRKSKECPKHTTEPHNGLESTQYHRLSHLHAKKRSESSPNTSSYTQSTISDCQQLVPNQILNRSVLGQNINFGSMCHAVLGCTRVT